MAHQSTATVGRAAEVNIEAIPALAVEMGVAGGGQFGRAADIQGRSAPQDRCDEPLQGALVENSFPEERTAENMLPTQHAALQVPGGRMSRTLQAVHEDDVQRARRLECQQQLMGVHWGLLPWLQLVEEIKERNHPHPIRAGDRCQNPKCDCYANKDAKEFWGYCCKQCAIRLREEEKGIIHDNPRPLQI